MATTPPVILGSVSNARGPGVTVPLVFSHNVASGTDVLFIMVAFEDFFQTLCTVTYGGVNVPLLNSHQFGIRPQLFILQNPTVGTADIVVTPGVSALARSIAASAYNIANYGGVRFGEWDFEPAPGPNYLLPIDIYNATTDLVIDWIWAEEASSGLVMTPAAGQTLLFAQNSIIDTGVRMASSLVPPGALSTSQWSLAGGTPLYVQYVLAIKGLDGTPPGVPGSVGPVTNTMTLEQQPVTPPGVPPALPDPGQYWQWRHTIPSTHRFLAVLVEGRTLGAIAVKFNGVALTLHTSVLAASLWYLENAPIGTFYIQVELNGRSWFSASAYSLNLANGSADIIACRTRNTQTVPLTIPSSPGAIVVDLIKQHSIQDMLSTPDAPQVKLFGQPVVINDTGTVVHSGTETGAGSLRIAVAANTPMGWTLSPDGVSQQIGFSFLGTLPPPPGGEGCPDLLTPLPTDGVGCPSPLVSAAASGTGCGGPLGPASV